MNNAAALYQAAIETKSLSIALQAQAADPSSPVIRELVKTLKRRRGSR